MIVLLSGSSLLLAKTTHTCQKIFTKIPENQGSARKVEWGIECVDVWWRPMDARRERWPDTASTWSERDGGEEVQTIASTWLMSESERSEVIWRNGAM
jgi:hypothetical protein